MFKGKGPQIIFANRHGNLELRAELAISLNDGGHGVVFKQGLVFHDRERHSSKRFFMPQLLPQFLTDVRSNGREHENEGLDGNARDTIKRGQVVVQNDQLGDSRVDTQVLVFNGNLADRPCQQTCRLLVHRLIANGDLARLFVKNISPQALKEALRADNCTRIPRTRNIQGPHAHFVDTEDIRTVGVVHLVRRDDILERLAHLAVFAIDRLPLPGEAACLIAFDLVSRNVLPASIGVRVSLHVALVKQRVVGLAIGNKSQIEENLLPEACIEQVKHSVLDTANVQVGATTDLALTRAHPIAQIFCTGEGRGVSRIGIAHFVPARTCPLRHGVRLTAVLLGTIAQIKGDIDPLLSASERRLGFTIGIVGVEGTR